MKKKKITKETFRKIPSLKFLYEVNPYGVVRNVKSKKILKGSIDKDGYNQIGFVNKNLGRNRYIFAHRLVAEVFIPNPNNYPVINHIDEDKQNNYYKNLEWCTVAYNNTYGSRLRQVSESHSERFDDILMESTGLIFINSKEAAIHVSKMIDKDNIPTMSRNIRNAAKHNKYAYVSKWKRIPKQ